LGYCLRVAFR